MLSLLVEPSNKNLEIRLIIYRLLLLPTSVIELAPSGGQNSEDDWADEDDDEELHPLDDVSDSDDSSDGFDQMMLDDVVFEDDGGRTYSTAAEANSETSKDRENTKKQPAILRVNRQIFAEASSVFYTEATLILDPGDIFCCAKKPEDLKFGAPNDNSPWRHNPVHGVGKTNANGVVTYATPEMGGLLDPHVFARFRNILFDACFDYLQMHYVDFWIDDETFVVNPEDAANFRKLVRTSPIIKDFVKILSNSPFISTLSIQLGVEVMAGSNFMEQEMTDYSDTDEERAELIMEKSNERATEMFLDSNICDALLKLRNVRNFEFKIVLDDQQDDTEYEPLPRHVKLFKEMKENIEGNFKASEAVG